MKLTGARVLVTGGSAGLGKETAKQLLERGAKVVITGRDQGRVSTVAQELGAVGIGADVADDQDIERTYAGTIEALGGLDVLINNAGIGVHKPLAELTREDYRKVFEVNVFGAAMMAKRAAEIFTKRGAATSSTLPPPLASEGTLEGRFTRPRSSPSGRCQSVGEPSSGPTTFG